MALASRPNILLLMADQLTPFVLPAYGHMQRASTPHLDALAAGGVVFDSAYCASPLCAPSRYSLMSGRLPSRIGAYDNAAELRADTLTFAHHLRHAGYRTTLAGKMHFCGPDQLHGFEERLTTDIYPADFGWTPDWDHPKVRPSWYHNMGSVIDAGPCVRTNQLDFDDETTFAARQRLYDIARDADPRPFLLVASLTHPHDPYAITREYWDRYAHAAIDMPAVRASDVAADPHTLRLRHVCDIDRTPPTEAQIRNARHAYYGSVSYVDTQFGQLLGALRDTGLDADTIVIVTSDHGEMLGERGLWYKMNFFEGGARVPLIVHAPGRYAPHRVAASVSHVDLLPTLVEIASGGAASVWPDRPDGRSLVPHLESTESTRGSHDEAIGEYLGEGAIAPLVMIRRRRYKFVHSPVDPDQLYDIAGDPHELRNLASDPEQTGRVAGFRREAAERWNFDALRAEVVASQRRRHFHFAAMQSGTRTSWDHQPALDASQRYMRNHIELDALEAMARFPRVDHE